jgi:hypothetical protein
MDALVLKISREYWQWAKVAILAMLTSLGGGIIYLFRTLNMVYQLKCVL